MQKRNLTPFGIAVLLAVFFLVLGLVGAPVTQVNAQTKTEICDNKVDDDDDKLIDCDDPDCAEDPACKKEPPTGDACSPGYWKNHTEVWFGQSCGNYCGGATDAEILDYLQAKGPGSSAIRQAAADCLEACVGRPCNE